MSKFTKIAVLLFLITLGIVLFSIFNYESKNTDGKLIPELSQSQQQTKSEPVNEIQTAPNVAGQDLFKKFLEEKAGKANTTTQSENSRALPVQSGKDPFKEFLEKQKQSSKDQVVSPFGKN